MPGVRLAGVSLRFGPLEVVSGVDLDVADGEFVTLLGPSGCGKTSTLRMIAGLQHNTTGRIEVGGNLVSDPASGTFVPPELRRLGMVFQSYAIWPHMTVFENVAYPLRVQRRGGKDLEAKVNAALQLVDMSAYAQRPAPALSGGQQQRVAIARALVAEPAVLLLDEPLSNLDAKLRTQMGEEFRSLQRRLGITTIYVTHDQEEAMALSDRIVLMSAGRVVQSGTPETLYRCPVDRGAAAFFGSPNFLGGRAEDCTALADGYAIRFDSPLGPGRCRSAFPVAPGDPIEVVVRPEDLSVRDSPVPGSSGGADEDVLVFDARVVDSVFRGPRSTVYVENDTVRWGMDIPSMLAPRNGAQVRVGIPFASLWGLAVSARPAEGDRP